MRGKKNRSLHLFSALFIAGVVCLILENTFYQYVDENGYLQESFFLPIGAFSILIGSLGIFSTFIFKFWANRKAR
jgi:hypothetical protein